MDEKGYIKELEAALKNARESANVEIKRLNELLQRDAPNVKTMEYLLTLHYGEPVRPVSFYCNAFRTWRQAIVDANKRGDYKENDRNQWEKVIEALNWLELPISKSNLLHRLIYAGEPLRLTPCPEHKGHWVGCSFGGNECEYGCDSTNGNITGWIPNP